jgi:hypothetical protein
LGGVGSPQGNWGFTGRAPAHAFLLLQTQVREAPDFDRIGEAAHAKQISVAGRDDDGLILEGHLRVDPLAIAPLLEWAADIAEEADALFDGWECAVIAPKQ